jgi:uncharacterized protein YbjT (DUF2867 family)
MAAKPTILVIGGTGSQGGSVARHLLATDKWDVVALTRNPGTEKAQSLRKQGIATIKGDLEDPPSLRRALEGCQGVFGVTDYWEYYGREYEVGRNLVDAVAQSRVETFVFSVLPHVKKITAGELDVPHFDLKGQLAEYTRRMGIPAIFIHVAFYYQNLFTSYAPKRQPDGTYSFGFPQGDAPLAGVSVDDIGGVVVPLLARPKEFLGKTVAIAGDLMPANGYAEAMSRVLGKKVVYQPIVRQAFAALGFPGSDDLADMFEFYRRFLPYSRSDVERTRSLDPSILRFEEWLTIRKPEYARALAI